MSEENLPVVAISNVPAWVHHGEDRIEELDEDKVLIVLHLCQGLSPEVAKHDTHKSGEIATRPTGDNLGTSFRGVVVGYSKEFVRFYDDDEDGDGVAERYSPAQVAGDSELRRRSQFGPNREKPELVETKSYILLVFKDGSLSPVPHMLRLSKTSLKTSKVLAAQFQRYPDTAQCYFVFEFSSIKESNERHTWSQWRIRPAGVIEGERDYALAYKSMQFCKAVAGRMVKLAEEFDQSAEG